MTIKYKKHDYVLVPTHSSVLALSPDRTKWCHVNTPILRDASEGVHPQHMYIISDAKMEVGDSIIFVNHGLHYLTVTTYDPMDDTPLSPGWKKIIGTSNTNKENIPYIGDDFIRDFSKHGGEKVLVGYNEGFADGVTYFGRIRRFYSNELAINEGILTVKTIESTFTIEDLKAAFYANNSHLTGFDGWFEDFIINKHNEPH